jgi:excisionase family DNA binding protein
MLSEPTREPSSQTSPALPEQEFLTIKQTAKYLNVSAAIVYRLVELKRLVHYRFGEGSGAIRINRHELLAFINQCRVGEKPGAFHIDIDHLRTRQAPIVVKHLRFDTPKPHPCGYPTKTGSPCELLTTEERCHLHKNKPAPTAERSGSNADD